MDDKVLPSVLKRAMPEIYEEYFPIMYPFYGTYDWLNRNTGLYIEDEKRRENAVRLLSSLARIVNDLKDIINEGLITKEEVISMFTDKPEH